VNITTLDRADFDEVVNHLGDIKVVSLSIDEDGAHVELDSPSAVSDGTVLAARASLPVTTVAPAFTEWTGALTSGSDFTVTAYGGAPHHRGPRTPPPLGLLPDRPGAAPRDLRRARLGGHPFRSRHPPGRNPVTTIRRTLTAVAALCIALLVIFALAYAITGDFQYFAAATSAALGAWCVSEPVRLARADEAAGKAGVAS
jgi:hypothetical protein